MCISGSADSSANVLSSWCLAAGRQFHLLPDLPGQVAHLARGSALQKLSDRDDAHGHGGALDVAGKPGQLSKVTSQPRVAISGNDLVMAD